MKCPNCKALLPAPSERADGLPGIRYRTCNHCGYAGAVTTKARKEKLPVRVQCAGMAGDVVRTPVPRVQCRNFTNDPSGFCHIHRRNGQ